MLKHAKFRTLFASRYPIILIDEYQDTNAVWVEAIKAHFLGQAGSPLFGFFRDHWQKIYEEGCGEIVHPALTVIGKQAIFRSVQTIVDCFNRMRPELTQFSEDPNSTGDIRVFHINNWRATRRTGLIGSVTCLKQCQHRPSMELERYLLTPDGISRLNIQRFLCSLTARWRANKGITACQESSVSIRRSQKKTVSLLAFSLTAWNLPLSALWKNGSVQCSPL
jgi:hypothetical protein